jgi:hypothetical protein
MRRLLAMLIAMLVFAMLCMPALACHDAPGPSDAEDPGQCDPGPADMSDEDTGQEAAADPGPSDAEDPGATGIDTGTGEDAGPLDWGGGPWPYEPGME